jgi:hypothetical protein
MSTGSLAATAHWLFLPAIRHQLKASEAFQQNDLPTMSDPAEGVLGVIGPQRRSSGALQDQIMQVYSQQRYVSSGSYPIELKKFWPGVSGFTSRLVHVGAVGETMSTTLHGAQFFIVNM